MKKTLWIIIIFIGLLYYRSIGESVDFKVIFNHALLSFNGMGKNQGMHYAR